MWPKYTNILSLFQILLFSAGCKCCDTKKEKKITEKSERSDNVVTTAVCVSWLGVSIIIGKVNGHTYYSEAAVLSFTSS